MASTKTPRSRELKALIKAAVIRAGYTHYRDFLKVAEVSNSTLVYQMNREKIDPEVAVRIEKAVQGHVTRQQLCPEIFEGAVHEG